MRSQFVTCDCGARMEVAPLMAGARLIECPKCRSSLDLSGLTWPEDERADAETIDLSRSSSLLPEVIPARPAGPPSKACAYCGGMEEASAIQCRRCGEPFPVDKRAHDGDPKPLALPPLLPDAPRRGRSSGRRC